LGGKPTPPGPNRLSKGGREVYGGGGGGGGGGWDGASSFSLPRTKLSYYQKENSVDLTGKKGQANSFHQGKRDEHPPEKKEMRKKKMLCRWGEGKEGLTSKDGLTTRRRKKIPSILRGKRGERGGVGFS